MPKTFQYRLRFFHKCSSPCTCDQGQVDRFQVQGCAVESTCGAPILVVLVRYRHDPVSGLSKECQRVRFAPNSPLFAIKVIAAPASSVLEYMDKPMLQQPRIVDSQGRNLVSGPDVSPDGSIYVTPLEQNGIAHLDNFALMAQAEGAAAASPVRHVKHETECEAEYCLLVQLLKKNGQRPGAYDAYDMPHLVSRPFTVVTRASLLARLAPGTAHHAFVAHQDPGQLQMRQQSLYQQNLLQQRGGLPGSVNGLGAVGRGLDPSPSSSMAAGAGAGAMGTAAMEELRLSSNSSGSPHATGAHWQPRPRRRSCLSKDSSHDDGGAAPGVTSSSAATAAGSLRPPNGVSAADPSAPGVQLRSTPMGAMIAAEASTAGPLALSRLPPPKFAGTSMAASGGGQVLGAEAAEGASEGLQHAPSATLMELHSTGIQDILEELEAQPLLAEDLMDLEGPVKRAKSNITTSDVASWPSSSSLLTGSQQNSFVLGLQQQAHAAGSGSNASNSSKSAPLQHFSDRSAERLAMLRQQGIFLESAGAELSSSGHAARPAGPIINGAPGGCSSAAPTSASQLDPLMLMLGDPGAMQEALDRMALEQQSFKEGFIRRGAGLDAMQL